MSNYGEMDEICRLEAEFCPPVDAALFWAVLSDFDPHNAQDLSECRRILTTIRKSACEELDRAEGSAYEPNEQEQRADELKVTRSHDLVDSYLSAGWSRPNGASEETVIGSESSERGHCSDATLAGSDAAAGDNQTESSAESDLERSLKELFPFVSDDAIARAAEVCGGDSDKTVEYLLNEAFIAEDKAPTTAPTEYKGVDGFFDDRSGRHKSRRKNRSRSRSVSASVKARLLSARLMEQDQPANKWDAAALMITTISTQAHQPRSLVGYLYHKNGGSPGRTVRALIRREGSNPTTSLDVPADSIGEKVAYLMSNFRFLGPDEANALVRLAHPSVRDAEDLAILFSTSTSDETVFDDDGVALSCDVRPTKPAVSPPRGQSGPSRRASPYRAAADFGDVAESYAKAAHFHRRAKSNSLFAAAAAHYTARGRELAVAARQCASRDADAMVAAQSSANKVDLHGVGSADAVRISLQAVDDWWDGLGERKLARGRDGVSRYRVGGYDPLEIVTGKGIHSTGKTRIGPAVVRALESEGWRLKLGSGNLFVTGRARG